MTRPLPLSPLQISPARDLAQMWILFSVSIFAEEQVGVNILSKVSKQSSRDGNLEGKVLLKKGIDN